MKKTLIIVLAAMLLLSSAAIASATDGGCPDGWETRTVPGVTGTFCYNPMSGYTLGATNAQGQGHIFWPDDDDDRDNTPPRPPRVPGIPSDDTFDDWLQYNQPADDVYVIVPGGWVRRKQHSDGTTRCYFHGHDGSLYNYGDC